MKKQFVFLFSLLIFTQIPAQPAATGDIRIGIQVPSQNTKAGTTVSLLATDSTLVKMAITDTSGSVAFLALPQGKYLLRITRIGHTTLYSSIIDLAHQPNYSDQITLTPEAGTLQAVSVTARKPLVQHHLDKTVINVEAGITNTGATVLEVLEKSPGVTVDRNGNISLKGRSGVQVMLDGKLTQLAGADLQNLLSGMNASQVEVIELIDNPSAKYDAAGNAGIINIKTKKNKQRGFNGNFTVSYGQGRYPKNNNSLVLNYRDGSFNYFLTYSVNLSKYFMDLYAIRTYYNDDNSIAALLEQPYNTRGKGHTHTLRTGVDYYLNNKTTLGIAFTGMQLRRHNLGSAEAVWMDKDRNEDSVIYTNSSNNSRLAQGGVNLNMRHIINAKEELTADIDYVAYNIRSTQLFENRLGSITVDPDDASSGKIPSSINILSAKADYSRQFRKFRWETGWKSSRVSTDNLAQYYFLQGNNWEEDLGKSNHFLYTENIHAAYTNFDAKSGKWSFQAGVRYEYTGYKANQLGNAIVKDSSFNRSYGNLFPSAFVSWQADSLNSFTIQAGRRIDRPAFQKLNPFVFIINKYTFQQGNPYFQPQFTWNLELTHQYKSILSTSFSYNLTKDYISQVFIADTSTGTIVYTEGNIGTMQNLGITVSAQLSPAKCWSLSAQATANHKSIEAVLWRLYKASINQANFSINNQFRFKKGWGAELSGFYITRNQNDLQEVLDPTGQVSFGISKQVLKNKGSLRFTFRDIFYTQAMAGITHFESVDEYFKLQRDTRVATISFTYRFGKVMKQNARRSTGGATDVMERVGTVN